MDHHGFAWWNGLERRSKGLQPLVTPQTHEEPGFLKSSKSFSNNNSIKLKEQE
jgi:hypothetical protein